MNQTQTLWNVPNLLSISRLAGTPFLFLLVQLETVLLFFVAWAALGITDFLDGKLARLWNQVSDAGAHLDATADVVFYLSTAWFLYYLFPDYIVPNLGYLKIFFVIFAVTIVCSLVLFRKVLFFHTHLSRFAGVFIFFVMIASFITDTTLFIALVIGTYSVALVEFLLIYLFHGDVSPDTRCLFRVKN